MAGFLPAILSAAETVGEYILPEIARGAVNLITDLAGGGQKRASFGIPAQPSRPSRPYRPKNVPDKVFDFKPPPPGKLEISTQHVGPPTYSNQYIAQQPSYPPLKTTNTFGYSKPVYSEQDIINLIERFDKGKIPKKSKKVTKIPKVQKVPKSSLETIEDLEKEIKRLKKKYKTQYPIPIPIPNIQSPIPLG